jgi:thermitase
MIELYPVLFCASAVFLVLWQYFSDKPIGKIFAPLFYISILGFALSFLWQPSAMASGGPKLILQLLFIGVTSLITKQLKDKPLALLITLSIIVIATILFVKWDSNRDEPLIPLAEHAELIVELKEGIAVKNILAKLNVPASRAFYPTDADATTLDNYLTIDAPDTPGELAELVKRLQDMDEVNYIEYNELVKLPEESGTLPPTSNKNLGVNDPGIKEQWGLATLNLEALHASLKNVKPKKKALIAILDTGVDAKHEDIKANYKSIKSKHDKDTHRHGTHCAGIAAAVTNNKKGIASLSPNGKFVEVTSVKVLSGFGGGTQSGIIAGMIEAADAGADVISMSLGGRTNDKAMKAYTDAVKYCNKKGAIVIVAAGNNNINANLFAPANTPGVITVSAVDQSLNKAKFSNTTEDIEMAVSAPGVDIYSTLPNNKYGALSGTSMSTPYVAGLVGIMKSINPALTTQEVYAILNDNGHATQDVNKIGRLIQPKKAIDSIDK